MIALFAALIGPWFINWDDYKANFEAEAEKILGQPVHVVGSADASILPSPSLTFTNVEVGDTEGQPMMTVEKFAVTIELLPLIQGEIRVISMKLEKPTVRVSVDDTGQVDWLLRTDLSRELDPAKVVLNGVEVTDGTLIYTDAGAGSTITLKDIRAQIEARTLAGPWRIEGSTTKDGVPVQFTVATGSVDNDGKLRVKVDATPGQMPIAIGADGMIGWSDVGLSYVGTYNLTQVVASEGREPGDSPGWRSEGSFNLTREKLIIDKAILTEGPPDRPSSLAGSMTVDLGDKARFEATVQARQLDLDRSLGAGPTKPVEVGAAADSFVEWLAGIPVPSIPGRVRFNVPGIVVGGSVIQDVRFVAMPEDGGWQIEGLQARLPGQATFQADGRLSTGDWVGFGGVVRLAVGQPATFANWWRGKSSEGAGRLLAPFDLSGRATVNLGGVAVEGMTTRIGDATITGGFSWSRASADSPERKLRTDLEADKLDFIQIKALAELLGGRDFADATAIADSYTIKLSAGELDIEDVVMRGVMIDAAFAGGGLAVNGIEVGDIGGASLKVTRGQIDDVLTEPLGRIEAQLTAGTLTGLARVVDRIAPDTRFSRWFLEAAPSLAPASLGITIDSVMQDGAPNSRLDIKGAAAATNFDATIEFAGAPEAWRTGQARFAGSLSSYDAVGVARQVGLDPAEGSVGGARINFSAAGIPAKGLEAKLQGSFGGLTVDSAGTLVLAANLPPTYSGSFGVTTEDIDPLVRMVGLTIPGAALGTPVTLSGDISSLGPSVELTWPRGEIAGHMVTGKVRVSPREAGGLRLEEGDLYVDTIDAGWVASLGLGFAPLPGDDPEAPWSRTSFSEPVFGHLDAAFNVATDEVTFGNALRVTNAKLTMALEPNRVEFDVKSGESLGGDVVGGFSIRNVGGNANVTGRMSLVGGALDTMIWQRSGRAVATGTLDISADFEATGRSPVGLISSLTGGGTLAIHDGEARYVNPRAANLVIRASDIGQQFSEEQLRDLFASYIDGGSLTFAEAEAAFSIAAGTIRVQNMTVTTPDAGASGSAAIDLNTMTIDSDWTLTLDLGDANDDGSPPQVGIVFRGPLSDPSRAFDVLQFNSYLNIRQEERIQQILIMEEEARLEKERLNRLRRKLREDADRQEREAEEARQARIAAARSVSDLHVMRDQQAEARAATENAAWWERMTAAAENKAAAEQAAGDAAAAADAAKQRAAEAMQVVETLQAAITTTSDAQRKAAEDVTLAETAAAKAEQAVADRQQALEEAQSRAAVAAKAVEAAEAALAEARARREAAGGDAGSATEGRDAALGAVAGAGEKLKIAKAAAEEAAARAGELADHAAELEETARGLDQELAAVKADATVKAETEVVATERRGEARDDAAATAERAKATLVAATKADAAMQAAVEFAKGADAALEKAKADAAAAAGALATAEAALRDARADAANADRAVEDARATVAKLEEARANRPLDTIGDVTLDGGNTFDDGSAQLDDARARLGDAQAAAAKAKDAVAAAEAKVAELTEQATASGKTVEAAQVALGKATDEAQSLVEPADAARAAAEEADAAAKVASLTAEAAATAAENAARAAREAKALADDKDRAYQDALKAAEAAAAEAGKASQEADAARADVATAEKALAAAQAVAAGAADDQAAAEALVADTAAAERAAADKLAGAKSRLEQAASAVDLAEQALAEAKDASDKAAALVEEKSAAEAAALGEASGARDELNAAKAAAEDAATKAEEAAAVAQDAARKAAALPRGWVEGRADTGDQAETMIDGEAITGAAEADVEEPVTLTDLPVVEEDAATIVPVEVVPPVMPRLRPNRPAPNLPALVDDGPKPVPQVRSDLPSDSEPLVITPPN